MSVRAAARCESFVVMATLKANRSCTDLRPLGSSGGSGHIVLQAWGCEVLSLGQQFEQIEGKQLRSERGTLLHNGVLTRHSPAAQHDGSVPL